MHYSQIICTVAVAPQQRTAIVPNAQPSTNQQPGISTTGINSDTGSQNTQVTNSQYPAAHQTNHSVPWEDRQLERLQQEQQDTNQQHYSLNTTGGSISLDHSSHSNARALNQAASYRERQAAAENQQLEAAIDAIQEDSVGEQLAAFSESPQHLPGKPVSVTN